MIERYSRPEMRTLWSDQTKYDTWLEVELAVCRAMEGLDIVPAGQADAISKAASGKLSASRIEEIEKTTRHDVIAFLTHVEEVAGEPARWLHLGMTSSDVLDTSLAMLCVRSADVIIGDVQELLTALQKRAMEHKMTPVIGRSHGIRAEPTSAGIVFARFYSEVKRSLERLQTARTTIGFGKIAGAVGTYGNLDPRVEQVALRELGLEPETVASQVVARDRHAEFLGALALLGTAVEQIAVTVRHWQRSEVGEAEEGFGKGQKGSSAMPHKKNPILSENLTGLARLLRGYSRAAIENVPLWHERDISHSSVERIALPDATALADFMVRRTTKVIDGLVVKPEKMMANLEAAGGLYNSEAVLLALVRTGQPRQRAYEWVQQCAMGAIEGKGSFMDLLIAHDDISKLLSAEDIKSKFDLSHHLRHVDYLFERAFS